MERGLALSPHHAQAQGQRPTCACVCAALCVWGGGGGRSGLDPHVADIKLADFGLSVMIPNKHVAAELKAHDVPARCVPEGVGKSGR